MHVIFKIPNVVDEIFGYLDGDSGQVDYKSCLAGALTCRAFLNPALNAIWLEITDLDPLFKTIPGWLLVGENSAENHTVTHLYFASPLLLPDIERMRSYARRIRMMKLQHFYPTTQDDLISNIEPVALTQVLSLVAATKEPLFPCLRKLIIEVKVDDNMVVRSSPYLALFLSPALQNLEFVPTPGQAALQGWVHAPSLWNFLQEQADSCYHYLSHLKICFPLPGAVIATIPRFVNLKSLRLDTRSSIDTLSLFYLCNIPDLDHLVLCTEHFGKPGANTAGDPDAAFSKLITLAIQTDIETLSMVLSTFRFPVLSGLSFYCTPKTKAGPLIDPWQRLFHKLAHKIPGLTIFAFQKSEYVADPTDLFHSLPWSTFSPFYRLPLLGIILRQASVTSLTNNDVTEMTAAWPDIEHMEIETETLGSIDHRSLRKLSDKCSKLSSLSLAVNLRKASPDILSGEFTILRTLKHLKLPQVLLKGQSLSAVRKMYGVAQYLDMLFPNLVDISCSGDDGLTRNLVDLIMGLQQARRRERKDIG